MKTSTQNMEHAIEIALGIAGCLTSDPVSRARRNEITACAIEAAATGRLGTYAVFAACAEAIEAANPTPDETELSNAALEALSRKAARAFTQGGVV